MSSDDRNEAELVQVLERFCSGFAGRDPEVVLSVCAPTRDLVMVTSEEPLLWRMAGATGPWIVATLTAGRGRLVSQ